MKVKAKRTPPRYRVVTDAMTGNALMTVNTDCALGWAGEVREFRLRGMYVYEVLSRCQKQVCYELRHTGDTMMCTSGSLADAIRYEARMCLRGDTQ